LRPIHADVASIMPELGFSDFQGGAQADGYGGAPDRAFSWAVGFEHKGNAYSQYMDRLDEVTALFNAVLDDNKSPYRIHRFYREAPVLEDGTYADGDFAAFGVVALPREQVVGLYYAGE
jgi:hypothetical protein